MENRPLAERLRPRTLDDIIGQDHLLGQDGAIRHFVRSKSLPSIILWGPPGVGKTTMAEVIAQELQRPFHKLSAINSGVKDVREVIQKSQNQGLFSGKRPLLFIDEIHRFSKSQQDSLLEAVEKGTITLIGATTENPSFEVISALLSRCQVYVLKSLDKEAMRDMIDRAIATDPLLKNKSITVKEYDSLMRLAGGDGRKLLNALEVVTQLQTEDTFVIENSLVDTIIKENLAMYDKGGEVHYDVISAFIKSIRGSDPQGAIYWLARMVAGGEDAKFIARRLVISAAEDIGLANPNALLLAQSCFDAVAQIGWPESRIILSECTVYLATSPKSNASYEAINYAIQKVQETGDLPVPLHLRNAPTRMMKDMGYGAGYSYSHQGDNNFIEQEYLPDELKGTRFYSPGNSRKEEEIAQRLRSLWKDKYDY